MTTPTPAERPWDDAGCRRRSCQHGHSYAWGECAYGVKPEPTLLRSDLVTRPDDEYPSLAFTTLTPAEVADWLRELGYTVNEHGPECEGGHVASVSCADVARRRAETRADPAYCQYGHNGYHSFDGDGAEARCVYGECERVLGEIWSQP